MRFSKIIRLMTLGLLLCLRPVYAQHVIMPPQAPPNNPTPMPQMPVAPPTVLPPAPIPSIPTQIPVAPPPADTAEVVDENPKKPTVAEMMGEARTLMDEIEVLDEKYMNIGTTKLIPLFQKLCGKDYCAREEMLAEAVIMVGSYQGKISYYQSNIDYCMRELDRLSEGDPGRIRYENAIAANYDLIAAAEVQLDYWSGERDRRAPLDAQIKEVSNQLTDVTAAKNEVQSKIKEKIYAAREKEKADMALAQLPKAEKEAEKKAVNIGEIGADDFSNTPKTGKSSETTDITPDKSLQELREDSLKDAFSELNTLDLQTGFLEKVDMTGQIVQTVVGAVPGMNGTDAALSGARGFAEALGEEMSKGTSWGDALKIASVNAGYKSVVSIVGNKLTAGADGLANRVAVLTEVGFSKLSTKQIAEYGSKGISFVVVKSGQNLTQELVDETAGKPAVKKVGDWIKDKNNSDSSTGSSRTSSGYGGGFGTSTASQPFVAY